MSNHDDLQPDLQPVIDQLRANRPEATALELDMIKQQVRARASHPARRRTRRAQLMKSRLVILTMLVFGMLLSTAGAGLAITGIASSENASTAQYPPPRSNTPTPPGGGVLGDQDEGAGKNDDGAGPSEDAGGTQPSRQAEAGADTGGDDELPFTGLAAIPILFGGLVLLGGGLVLRSRASVH